MQLPSSVFPLPRPARWLLIILAGLILFYVLYVFRSYGIQPGDSYSGHSLLQRSLAFGLLNAGIFYLLEFHLIRHWPQRGIGGFLLWLLLELWIGSGATFLLFNYFWNGSEWSFRAYTLILQEYPLVMLFPLAITYSFAYLRKPAIADRSQLLRFTSENEKEVVRIRSEDLLYIQSDGNYLDIHFLKNDQPAHHLLRNRLKIIQAQADDTQQLVRCHRSYLVNPMHIRRIIRVKGRMQLDLGTVQLPVSASYEHLFL